jgi:hypothetical protein
MADRFDLRELLVDLRNGSIELDDQNGFGGREIRVDGRFHRDERDAVHDLDRRGNDPGGDDLRNGRSRRADRIVCGEQRLHRLGPSQNLDRHFGDDRERSL